MRRLIPAMILTTILMATAAVPAAAKAQRYTLDPSESVVQFTWDFGADRISGQMPVASAQVLIDFRRLANCKVTVAVDVTRAEAGFLFATQALKGPKMLDAGAHPQITFVSRSVRPEDGGARLDGDITVRGVTRPMVFHATFHQQPDGDPATLDHLQIALSGAIHRSDFGATGWSDAVGDTVGLHIVAAIDIAR